MNPERGVGARAVFAAAAASIGGVLLRTGQEAHGHEAEEARGVLATECE